MKSFEKKIKNASAQIRMRAEERALLRERIVSFMEYHPFASATNVRVPKKNTSYTDRFSYIRFTSWQVRGVVGVFIVAIFIVTPLVAERAVPGDVLYAMKVRVNEEVLAQLSFGSYEKVAWETRRVERRIAEARLLAKEGKLTDEVEAQITATVKEHTAKAQKELAVLRVSDADQAAIAQVVLESAFDVQSAVLEKEDSDKAPGAQGQIRALALVVRDAKDSLKAEETGTTTPTSYERFSGSVEEATTRAHELHLAIKGSVTEDERVDIQRRLDDVGRKILLAQEAYARSATGTAIQKLKESLGDTQKLISFMVDINVRRAVSLESLVPKELTLEEQQVIVSEAHKDIVQKMTAVTERIERIERIGDTDLRKKVSLGLADIEKNLMLMSTSTNKDTIGASQNAKKEAQAIIEDLLMVTESFKNPEQGTPEATTSESTTTAPTATSSVPKKDTL